jgi:hypothetical protein
MKKSKIISSLNKIANILDDNLFHKEADNITKIMIKLSAREDEFQGPNPEQPDDAYDLNKIINPPTEFDENIPQPEHSEETYDEIIGKDEPIRIPFPTSGHIYGIAYTRGQFNVEVNIQFTNTVSSRYEYPTNETLIADIVRHTERNIQQYWFTLKGLDVYFDLPKTIQNVNIKITEPDNDNKLLFQNDYAGDVQDKGKVKLTAKSATTISNLYEVSNLRYNVEQKFEIDKFIRLLQSDVPDEFIAEMESDPKDVRWNKMVYTYQSYFGTEEMLDSINDSLEQERESEEDDIREIDEEQLHQIISEFVDEIGFIYHSNPDMSDERFATISIKEWIPYLNKKLWKIFY